MTLLFVSPYATLTPAKRKCALTRHEAATIINQAATSLSPYFFQRDLITQQHTRKLIQVFRELRLGVHHFNSPDGYAHGDQGRALLDQAYSRLFECEAALVRVQFLSGTHAIACVLFGVLRPGDRMVSVAGPVYDTLEEVIGIREESADIGSLKDWGISYGEVPVLANGRVDLKGIHDAIDENTKLAFIQRSFGYAWRNSLSNREIAEIVGVVKGKNAECICFVDNCYGELVEEMEPVHGSIGADVMAGSLIKNLGGGIAPSGGYVAGRKSIVDKACARFAAPGVGGGATLGMNRTLFQGLFLAPSLVGEGCKGSMLVAEVMGKLGYETKPENGVEGFVRAVKLGSREKLKGLCGGVQRNGAVGSFIEPVVGESEGYGGEVIFAQGTFIDGSTSELSADGAAREPFVGVCQGGGWGQWAIALEDVVVEVGYAEE